MTNIQGGDLGCSVGLLGPILEAWGLRSACPLIDSEHERLNLRTVGASLSIGMTLFDLECFKKDSAYILLR